MKEEEKQITSATENMAVVAVAGTGTYVAPLSTPLLTWATLGPIFYLTSCAMYLEGNGSWELLMLMMVHGGGGGGGAAAAAAAAAARAFAGGDGGGGRPHRP